MTGTGPLGQSGIKPSRPFEEHWGGPEVDRLDWIAGTGLIIVVLILGLLGSH